MYELFILGELMDQPLHGYLLREIINLSIGPLRQMSWGALYPLLRRLEAAGLIVQVPDSSESGERPRKIYQITSGGRERFFFLMLRPEEYSPDYPDVFDTKLLNFDHLTPAQRQEAVQQYKGYVQFLQEQLRKSKRFVTVEPHIAAKERAWILHCLDHRLHIVAADLQWVEQLEAQLEEPAE